MDILAKFAALTAVFVTAAITLLSRDNEPALIPYVALLSLGSVTVFWALWQSKILSAGVVLTIACVLHIIAIFGYAAFEDDYFRFIWDGWRTANIGTPYGIAPADFFTAALPDDSLALTLNEINNPKLPTIYGPTLQFVFWLAYLCAGTNPLGLKILFASINLILSALLLRWTTPQRTALYAWCPLVVSEIVIHIHPDAIMAMLLLAGLLLAKRHPLLAGLFFGLAAGAKIVALALWPLLLRMGWRASASAAGALVFLYGLFLIQGQGAGFDSTSVFAGEWNFNPLGFAFLNAVLPSSVARLVAAFLGIGIIMVLHARTRSLERAPITSIFGVILLFAPAVNSWYLLWLLPFAAKDRMIWPYAAAAALPLSYFTGLNLNSDTLGDFGVHPAAWTAQICIILVAIIFDYVLHIKAKQNAKKLTPVATPILYPKIAIIIPALNEETAIGDVVCGIKKQNWLTPPVVIVADNGSTDDTIKQAQAASAQIAREPHRGYGAACLAGIAAVPKDTNILLFMDGDGADVPSEALGLIAPLLDGSADLVIGSRALGHKQKGAMTMPQQFGNWLATRLVWIIWNERMTDLGPFRAIRMDSYERLKMADRDFGWTIEMQVKAVRHNLRIAERPANYLRRVGVSKISGTVRGVFLAGNKILFIIGREAFCR